MEWGPQYLTMHECLETLLFPVDVAGWRAGWCFADKEVPVHKVKEVFNSSNFSRRLHLHASVQNRVGKIGQNGSTPLLDGVTPEGCDEVVPEVFAAYSSFLGGL